MYRISLQVLVWLSKADYNDVTLIPSRSLLMYSSTPKHVHPRKDWPLYGGWASRPLTCGANRTGQRNTEKARLKGRVRVSSNHFQLAELWLEPCDNFRRCTIGSQFITYGNMINGIKCLFFGNIQERSASQLLGVQGSENLFHEFKVRQMRLNERGPDAKAMITK